jgi:nucleoredoxin
MKQLFTFFIFIISTLGAFANDKYIGNPTWDTFMKDQLLLDVNGSSVSHDVLRGKYVGFYFSASWCGPCKKFTKKLIEFRNRHSDKFEFVLVSLDANRQAKADYFASSKLRYMYGQSKNENFVLLRSHMKSVRIPSVILFNPDRKFITDVAQKYIVTYPNDLEKWFGK